ncbi:hypothetical protein RIF29_04540 [Crotalaria pallida]|uniref:Uncharacterized protein n=1 Tax=Crotalaria pallida TaxID=3830 RepID=A0AAN9P9B7_CROPI
MVIRGLFSLTIPLSIPPLSVSSLVPPLTLLFVPLSHGSSFLCVGGSSVVHALSLSHSVLGSVVDGSSLSVVPSSLSLGGSWFISLTVWSVVLHSVSYLPLLL